MSNLMQKKYFHFAHISDASDAMNAWWSFQDKYQINHTKFITIAYGDDTDVTVAIESINDQPGIITFFKKNFDGKYTVDRASPDRPTFANIFGE